MRVRGGKALAAAMLLAGCAAPQSSGIVPLDPGRYGLTVTSRSLGTAAEMALSEATGFCTRQGEQTQLLRTQINPGDYQLVFRCVGAVPPAGLAARGGRFETGGPGPEAAPILRGQAFAAQAFAAQAFIAPALPPAPDVPRPSAMPVGYARPSGSGLPAQPPTLGALMAAARVPARPVPKPVAQQGWFDRAFRADDAPGASAPSPLPAGMQPFRSPEPARAEPPPMVLETVPAQLASPGRLPPPPPPLQSPLLGRPASERAADPVFAPLPASALAPVAAPRSFESLPPVTGLPGGPPQRALTPLPPIGESPPPRVFVTDVSARLPPPTPGPATSEATGAGGASVTPPAGFWDLRRN